MTRDFDTINGKPAHSKVAQLAEELLTDPEYLARITIH